jgi:hypothetical protein
MKCKAPTYAWPAAELSAKGRRGLVFNPKAAQPGSRMMEVACGKCLLCLKHKGKELAVRLAHDLQVHGGEGCFVTLTYDDDHVPEVLDREDGKGFANRAAKYLQRKHGRKLRMVMVGDYGALSGRPHWHAVVIGFDFCETGIKVALGRDDRSARYVHTALDDLWRFGMVDVRPIARERVVYTAMHKVKCVMAGEKRPIPRPLVPRRPGLGFGWCESFVGDSMKGFVTLDGIKFPVPSAYMRREEFYDDFADLRESRAERAAQAPLRSADDLDREADALIANVRARLGLNAPQV